jgi:hypothetical protein
MLPDRQTAGAEEEARLKGLMAEGYEEMAEENLREAQEALNLTSNVMLETQYETGPSDTAQPNWCSCGGTPPPVFDP